MPTGILFTGGSGPSQGLIEGIVRKGDIICAADSGLEAAIACGIQPEAVVGDMDSLSDLELLRNFPQENIEKSSVEKDVTDTEIGIAWLRRRGCDSITIIGGGEGRLDHTLALVKILEGNESSDILWFTAREVSCIIEDRVSFIGEPDDIVSVYPIGWGPWKADSQGLRWELNHVNWAAGLMSLSNRMLSSRVRIEVKSGRFLLIRSLRNDRDQFLRRFKE